MAECVYWHAHIVQIDSGVASSFFNKYSIGKNI